MIALAAAAGALALGAAAHGIYEPNSPIFGRAIGAGPDPSTVYLTFDDGPNPGITDSILDVLARAQVPAAFFMVGQYAVQFPAVVRRAHADGHVIGNHTWTHTKLHRLGPARVRDELDRTHGALGDITGAAPATFRAPHGYRTPFVTQATRRLGYTTFGWSFGVWDTARPGADVIRRRMAAKVRGGSILLLHDGDGYALPGAREQTLAALPGIIDDVRAAGLRFGTLTDLARPVA